MSAAKNNKVLKPILLALALLPVIAATLYLTYFARYYANQRAQIKEDYSQVNDISMGLMNVNVWREELKEILNREIQNFDFSPKQDSILRTQVTETLLALVDEAKAQIKKDDETLGKRIRNFAIETIVNWEKVKERVPVFTDRIIAELHKQKNKDRLKIVATEKIEQYADKIYEESDSIRLAKIYQRYGVNGKSEFNQMVTQKTKPLRTKAFTNTYFVLGVLVLSLLPWFWLKKYRPLQVVYFAGCVVLALSVLLAGLSSPMIEIDARISTMEFSLLGQDLIFENQMLFYRSKSIVQMVSLLLTNGKADSIFVGLLILAFSVLLPISKLIGTQFYLHGGPKLKSNKLLAWLALKSGKWSMADVMVVAIFMAFVGFDGILDNQLKAMDYNTDTLRSLSTNQTALEPGFLLFLGFVLYSLILAAILKRIAK
jgi:hypothetical protein